MPAVPLKILDALVHVESCVVAAAFDTVVVMLVVNKVVGGDNKVRRDFVHGEPKSECNI